MNQHLLDYITYELKRAERLVRYGELGSSSKEALIDQIRLWEEAKNGVFNVGLLRAFKAESKALDTMLVHFVKHESINEAIEHFINKKNAIDEVIDLMEA